MANTFDQFDNPVVSGARDVGTALTLGANDILGITGNVAKIVTGKDNFLTELAKKNTEALQAQKSPELIAAEQDRDEAVAAEPNLLYAIGTYVKKTASDPRLFTTTVAQTAPSSIGPGLVGAGARMAAGKLLAKKGAEFATKTGLTTAIGTGVGMQAADVGGQQVDDLLRTLESMDDETTMQIPQIADLVKNKGYSIPEAKATVASYIGMQTAFGAGTISALTQMIPGAQTIEKAIVGGTEKAAGKTLLSKAVAAGKGAVKGAVGETLQEVPEEGGGQYLANILARPVEPEREATAGVASAVGQAIVGAGTLGAVAGAKEGAPVSRPEPTPRPVPESRIGAGISEETPAPAATKPSLAPEQAATLERSEEMSPDQFWATVNIRQARLLGGEPNPEDVRLVGEVPPPRVVINPDVMNGALDEAYGALNTWRAENPNAPENIVLIFDPEMLHNGYGIQGAFNPKDGAIFINTAFVAPENIGKIVSHEWAHSTLATAEGRQALADFALREIPQEDLDALATRYGTQDRLTLLEEWIAENQEKAPGVISRIVARIREWLSNFGIVNLNDREVADIMLRTLREQAEGKVQPDVDQVGGAVETDPNSEIYDQFASDKLGAVPKYALQKLPTAADVTDANGKLRYTVPQKTLDVSHYSFVPDLTEIDPAYYGTGSGEHYHRMMKGINKSFFFVGNSKPRRGENVSGKGMNRYRTSIDSSRVYNMDEDPLDLWFAPNPQKSEGLLKELGYDGFLAKTDDGRSFVALFYPTSLETGEVTRTAPPTEEALPEAPQESAEDYLARVEREEAAERRKALRRASTGKYSLSQEQVAAPDRDISGILASPSITDIDYERARKNLTSADQARFKNQIAEYAPEAKIYDAIGDWKDGAENSVAAIYDGPKSSEELQRIAAKAGLAGYQKAILWWTADKAGADAIHQIFWPKGVSMDEARQAMKDVGLDYRTLIQTPEGIRGLVFDQGRQNINKIELLHEHPTEPSLDSHNATGDFLGSWSTNTARAEGRRAYRRVLGSPAETEAGARGGEAEQRAGVLGGPETRFSLAQTKTPEFRRWFKDSVATDESGRPQIYYHGTPSFEGAEFKPSKAINRSGNVAGYYFTPDAEEAGYYATGEEGAQVLPVYLSIQNPFIPRKSEISLAMTDQYRTELEKSNTHLDPSNSWFSSKVANMVKTGMVSPNALNNDGDAYQRVLKAGGYDGFQDGRHLAAFEPTQIKSATGNVGTFDRGNRDYRFSLAQTKTPEFKRWFGDSQIVTEEGNPRVMYHGTFNRRNFTGRNEDFTVFRPKAQNEGQPGVVFASPNPQLASEFTGVTPSFLKQFSGDELGEKRPGARVYPVFVKAENPFDYENPRHVQMIFGDEDYIELVPGSEEGGPYGSTDYDGVTIDRAKVENGNWTDIEYLLGRIKDAGFDGAYVSERDSTGERAKNIAVFDPDQLKSATGNVGAFGQRPVTAEEAERMGLTEEEAAEEQRLGDIRMSLTGKPVGEQALEDAKTTKFKNQKGTAKYLGNLLKEQFPEGLDNQDPETASKLAELLDRELSLALTMPDNADAIGWYGREMDKVVQILASPELNYQLDDPVNRGIFNALLAITSNGQEVVDQFLKSAELYEGWRKNGTIPAIGKWGGERNRAMKGQLKFLNMLMEQVGPEKTVDFLTSENSLRDHLDNLYGMVAEAHGLPAKATVEQKEDAVDKYLNAGIPSGELKDYNTVGAIVFGPKLGGGFFANLYGKFDRLTMDRWFMRTFHRMTGRLGFVDNGSIQGALDEARRDLGIAEYFTQLAAGANPEGWKPVSKDRLSDEELLNYIKTEGKKAFKGYKEIKSALKKDPNDASLLLRDMLRRTYNRIIKAESGLFDSPDNGTHRVFIRDVLDQVQKLRAERGEEKIDTSDIQAILWYLEKDIWDKLKDQKVKDDIDEQDDDDDDSAGRVSYSNGARELYRQKTGKEYVFKNELGNERSKVLASD